MDDFQFFDLNGSYLSFSLYYNLIRYTFALGIFIHVCYIQLLKFKEDTHTKKNKGNGKIKLKIQERTRHIIIKYKQACHVKKIFMQF